MLVVSVLVGLPLSDVVAYRYAKIKRMMQSASVRYMETGLPKHLIFQKPILIQEFIVYCHLLPYPIIQYTSSWPIRSITIFYYSFKIFSRFWLVKTKRIIHHNQLLNCHIEPMTSKWRQKCYIERLTKKTWGRDWIVLVLWTNGGTVGRNIVLSQEQQEVNSTDICYLEYIYRPEQTFIC